MQRSALCRSRRELSNEYLLAKIGVDTDENEPLEVWGKIQFIIHLPPYRSHSSSTGRAASRRLRRRCVPAVRPAGRTAAASSSGASRRPHFSKMHFRKMRFRTMHLSNMHFREMHFSKILQIFGGLVLGCIKTSFCKKICG